MAREKEKEMERAIDCPEAALPAFLQKGESSTKKKHV